MSTSDPISPTHPTLLDSAQNNLAEYVEGSGSAVELLIKPRESDLGGFIVRRLLPVVRQRMVGPWIFFDHMAPATFQPGQGIDVRPHPHINLATVTYLFEGEVLHRDSLGTELLIHPGDLNLMIAGRGITHSERERAEVKNREHRLHALQLWVAVPAEFEETDPEFHHYEASELPRVDVNGVPVRVLIGEAYGKVSPVKQLSPTLYVEADLAPGQTLELPDAVERAVYVCSGAVAIGEQHVAKFEMAVLAKRRAVIRAVEPTRVAIIGGAPLGKRYIQWNFVSSRPDRIEQAKADWIAQTFPKIPGDDNEFIPLPDLWRTPSR